MHDILLLLLRLLSTVYCLLLSTLLQSTFTSLLHWFKGPKMGILHSTARDLAPAPLLYDFAAQQYGILSPLNMKDVKGVYDANLAAFSPRREQCP